MAQLITFPRKDKRRHTILVVDHEPVIRELLCSALNDAGFNAFAIPSADDAARMLDRDIFSIDLVFCDADVPGIDETRTSSSSASVDTTEDLP